MSEPEPTPIGALADGAVARIAGRVVPALASLLTSPLGGKACVYFDVRRGLEAAPERREALDFWVEDETGRVLVRADALAVEARARRQQTVVESATSDIQAVSARIKELKDRLREVQGPASASLVAERKRLSKVATLLCAVRAQARGNVHLGGTLKSQARWIEQNQGLAQSGLGAETIKMVVDRYEVLLEPGSRVELRGVFHVEPMPPGYSRGGGYREAPTCVTARGPDGGPVVVEGQGEAAPLTAAEVRAEEAAARAPAAPGRSRGTRSERDAPAAPPQAVDRAVWITLALVSFAVGLAWALTR